MSKRPNMGIYDDEGYMRLIPRSTQCEAHRSSIHEGEDIGYWKARCKELEEENAELKKELDDILDVMDQQRELLESRDIDIEAEARLRLMQAEEATQQRQEQQARTQMASIEEPIAEGSDFDWGLGLRFGGGKDPEVYRISDPKGPLVQKRKFAGGVVEVQPGRGFRVGLRWKADK